MASQAPVKANWHGRQQFVLIGFFLSTVVNARTECQDLQWQFDAVGRLAEAQTLAQANEQEIQRHMDPLRFLSPGPLWWVFDWNSAQEQWNQAASKLEKTPQRPDDNWQPQHGSVLLIDEIDKADADLPNSLLETLGNGDFSVPYLSESVRQSKDSPQPLVIITTNEERELPAAFLRRCLVLQLSLPEEDDKLTELLVKRGEIHFGRSCSIKVRQKAAELLLKDRKAAHSLGLPLPGQAEYLDLLRALQGIAKSQKQQLEWLVNISDFVLKKSRELLP